MSLLSSLKSLGSSIASGVKSAYGAVNRALSGSNQTASVANYNVPTQTQSVSNMGILDPSSPTGMSNYVPPYAGIYPTPTGRPITTQPTTITKTSSNSGGSGGSVLGANTTQASGVDLFSGISMPTNITSSTGAMGVSGSPTSVVLPSTPTITPANFDLNSLLTPELAKQGFSIKNNQLVNPETQEETKQDTYTERAKAIKNAMKEMFPEPPSQVETYQELERQSGIVEKRNLVNSLTSQLNAITAKRDADLLNLRGIGAKEGVTETVYGGQQNEINREAAIRALPIAAQLSAAQNDLETAQTHLDKYFSIISQDAQNKLNYQWKMYDSIMNIADKEEQREITAKKEQLARNSTNITNSLNFAQQVAMEALKNGNQSVFSRITSLPIPDPYSATFNQDLQNYNAKVAQYGQVVNKPTYDNIDVLSALASNPDNQSILAQAGISYPAFLVLTGQSSSLPRDQATRNRAFAEAQAWANKKGVDISTFGSQYQALNKTVQANTIRNNQAQIAENELTATLANLRETAGDDFNKLRWANVVKLFAGKEVNDPIALKYQFHLEQLRNEFGMYQQAVGGQLTAEGNLRELTEADYARIDNIIKNGLAKGGFDGFEKALNDSRSKMGVVLAQSINNQRKQIWNLFGVGDKFKSSEQKTTPTSTNNIPYKIGDTGSLSSGLKFTIEQ
jgi:ABC-type dipeptide/oligopeptide/nickel transport system ATPase component